MNRTSKFGNWKRYNKYRAQKTVVDGVHYDSKFESRVGWELELRLKAGDLKEIHRQVDFPLVVNNIKICTYRADFVVVNNDDQQEVYEAKGMMLPISQLKLNLFEALYPHIKLNIVRQ